MYHIQWLKYVGFLITCFPGILLVILRNISKFRYISEFYKYLISISFVILFNSLFFINFWKEYVEVIILLVIPITIFLLERKFLNFERRKSKLATNDKIALLSIVLYPIMEELNYRYFILIYSSLLGYSSVQFIMISTLTFVFSHFLYQGNMSLIKIVFSFIQASVMVFTNNVFIVIGIHVIFNVLVYFEKSKSYNKYRY